MIDWSKVKFRASSWGNLLTEPVLKSERELGNLSVTCQKELLKIYELVKYGRKKDIITKQMQKGLLAEGDSITLFSMLEGQLFYKNDDPLENDWFSGHPDIFTGESVKNAEQIWDIKSSWDLSTFLPKLVDRLDQSYEAQLNVYYSLTGAKSGGLAYCLVSAPDNILMDEKRKLLYSMNVVSEDSPDFKKASQELEKLMVFNDIPEEERCIKIEVPRNEELIEKMKAKVPKLREWLYNFDCKHSSFYLKR